LRDVADAADDDDDGGDDDADDDDDDGDDYDDDARTRHRRKRCQSATRRTPRIGVSEQTDDASRNAADDVTAMYRRSLAPSDAREDPAAQCLDCTAANQRLHWYSQPM